MRLDVSVTDLGILQVSQGLEQLEGQYPKLCVGEFNPVPLVVLYDLVEATGEIVHHQVQVLVVPIHGVELVHDGDDVEVS